MDDSQIRLIQYLDGELDSSEKDALESQLKDDKALRQELERLQQIKTAINISGEKALKSELDQYLKDYKDEEQEDDGEDNSSPRIWYAITALAATVILLALFNPFKSEDSIPLQPQIDQAPIRADSTTYNEEVKSQTDSLKDENSVNDQ